MHEPGAGLGVGSGFGFGDGIGIGIGFGFGEGDGDGVGGIGFGNEQMSTASDHGPAAPPTDLARTRTTNLFRCSQTELLTSNGSCEELRANGTWWSDTQPSQKPIQLEGSPETFMNLLRVHTPMIVFVVSFLVGRVSL